jgi:hypothetical protein
LFAASGSCTLVIAFLAKSSVIVSRLSLAAIVRLTGVSERWLQSYVNQKYYLTPKQVEVAQKNLEN